MEGHFFRRIMTGSSLFYGGDQNTSLRRPLNGWGRALPNTENDISLNLAGSAVNASASRQCSHGSIPYVDA